MMNTNKVNLESKVISNLPRGFMTGAKATIAAASLFAIAAPDAFARAASMIITWETGTQEASQILSYGPTYKADQKQYPYRISLGPAVNSYAITLPDTTANVSAEYYFSLSRISSTGVETGYPIVSHTVVTRANATSRVDGTEVDKWTKSAQTNNLNYQADGSIALESLVSGDLTVTAPLSHARSSSSGGPQTVSNPYLVIQATAVGTAAMSPEIIVRDVNGKSAAFMPKYQLRTDVPNLIVADLSNPSLIDAGFDKTEMRTVEFNVYSPNSALSASGPNKVFLKYIDALDSRNVLLSGNFVPSTNAYSAGNYGVFGNVSNTEVKNLSELAGQGIGSTYLGKYAIMNTTLPALAVNTEVAFVYTMSSAEISRLPLSGTAIEVTMGSNTYSITSDKVVAGTNPNIFVLQNAVSNNAPMSVKVYQRAYLPRTLPGVPVIKQVLAYVKPNPAN